MHPDCTKPDPASLADSLSSKAESARSLELAECRDRLSGRVTARPHRWNVASSGPGGRRAVRRSWDRAVEGKLLTAFVLFLV